MTSYNIDKSTYEISNEYKNEREAWITCLDDETKELILDFTIMWNMLEHQVFDDSFNGNYNKNEKCDICCDRLVSKNPNNKKTIKIMEMFNSYNKKYTNLEQQYDSYGYEKCRITFDTFKEICSSMDDKTMLKYLIYSCYRIRCNLFHGPKCIYFLDEQKLLFLAMNELMVMIAREYRY